MGNPFARPKNTRTSDLANILRAGTSLGQFGLDLYKTRQQELTDKEKLIQGKEQQKLDWYNAETNRQEAQTKQGQVNVNKALKDIKVELDRNTSRIPDREWATKRLQAQQYFMDMGVSEESIESVLTTFDGLQKSGASPEAMLTIFATNQEQFLKPARVEAEKRQKKLMGEGHVMGYSPELKETVDTLSLINSKELPIQLFPKAYGTIQYKRIMADRKEEIETTKMLQKYAQEEKIERIKQKPTAQYGAPTKDQYGNIIQQDQTTGKLAKVSGPRTQTEPRALKTWTLSNGKTVNLPNNVKPPEGSTPYDQSGKMEERLNKSQEVGFIKQNIATIDRQLPALKQKAGIVSPETNKPLYPELKTQVKQLEDERKGYVQQLKELWGKDKKTKETYANVAGMPSAKQNKGKTIKDGKTGKTYSSDGTGWIEQ